MEIENFDYLTFIWFDLIYEILASNLICWYIGLSIIKYFYGALLNVYRYMFLKPL